MRVLAALWAAALVTAHAPTALAAGSGWRAPALPADASPEVVAAVKAADALYDARDADGGKKAYEALQAAVASHPDAWDLQWRLARAAFWVSEGLPAKAKAERKAVSQVGWNAGEAAMKLHPDRPEGPYFMALCIGEYSRSIGVLTALRQGIEAKFRDPLLAVSKKAPGLDHGGVWNALGRYKFELPWPKKDVNESIRFLRKAIEVNPANVRARVFLAESLEDRDDQGDVDEAKKLLAEVARAPGRQYDPPEEQRAVAMARDLARRLGWQVEGL